LLTTRWPASASWTSSSFAGPEGSAESRMDEVQGPSGACSRRPAVSGASPSAPAPNRSVRVLPTEAAEPQTSATRKRGCSCSRRMSLWPTAPVAPSTPTSTRSSNFFSLLYVRSFLRAPKRQVRTRRGAISTCSHRRKSLSHANLAHFGLPFMARLVHPLLTSPNQTFR